MVKVKKDKIETLKSNLKGKLNSSTDCYKPVKSEVGLADYPLKTKWDKFKIESDKIKELISPDVLQILKEHDAILAGGALTSVFTNSPVNDLDIYFKSELDLILALGSAFSVQLGKHKDGKDTEFLTTDNGFFNLVYICSTKNTLMFKDNSTGQEIQFMTFNYYDNPEDIFDNFDFTCCMAAYSFKEDGFFLQEDFLKSNSQRLLKFHTGTAYPIMSLLRVDKYKRKGYQISLTEMLKIIFTCNGLGIKTWDDLKNHISGLYGYEVGEVFDTDSEFSFEKACELLEDIPYKLTKRIPHTEGSGKKFKDILSDILFEEVEDPFKRTKPNTYFKFVSSDWSSYYVSWKRGDAYSYYSVSNEKKFSIDYSEESLLRYEKDHFGIYVVPRGQEYLDNCQTYWVEVELLNGSARNDHANATETILEGDVKVLRRFKKEESVVFKELYKKYGIVQL